MGNINLFIAGHQIAYRGQRKIGLDNGGPDYSRPNRFLGPRLAPTIDHRHPLLASS